MKLFLTAFLLILASANLSAADVSHSSTILSIDQNPNGDVAVRFTSDHSACTNGNSPKYYYLRANDAASGNISIDTYKNIFSMLMSAGIAKKSVSIVFDDSSNACWIKRAIVTF